jgi:putative membrane protein
MYWWGWTFAGMSFLWWLFWVILIVAFFALATPVPRRQARHRLGPFEILQRRYAAGEISTAEYEERKALLLRDRDLGERRVAPPPPASPAPQT